MKRFRTRRENLRQGAWLWLLLVVLLSACGGDGDDVTAPGDDAAGDDIQDDDAADDDAGDDDTGPVAPLEELGWMLLCNDRERAAETIEAAPAFGVDQILLSHDIIEDIDQIPADPAVAEQVAYLSDLAHQQGMTAHVWVHELVAPGSAICCFDPADPYWEARKDVYREALALVPEIDGVQITMGSGSPPPWFAMCLCPYCLDLPPYGHLLMDLLHSHPDERIRQVMHTVAEVVTDEWGRETIVHDFHHERDESLWMIDALSGDPRTDYRALIKCQNHDWQPYYPTSTVFGRVGPRGQIIGFDLGGEYWGQGVLPFCEVEQIQRRLLEAIPRGATAASARVERGCNRAMGTPNEVNLYALSRLAEEPDLEAEVIWRDWMEERYGLPPGSPEAALLTDILRSTFDVGRKMYYVEGFWVFGKSSEFPEVAREAETLVKYRNTKWDAAWESRYRDLRSPTAATVRRIWQEKTEAVQRAERNLAAFAMLEGKLVPEDYADTERRLRHQWYATRLWRLAADVIWRYQLYKRTGEEAEAARLEGSAQALSALADEVKDVLGPDIWPGNPGRVRTFLADLREVFPGWPRTEPVAQLLIQDVTVQSVTRNSAVVTWTTSEPAAGWVEYGTALPQFGAFTDFAPERKTEHRAELTGLRPFTHYYFRAGALSEGGEELVSGDYRFRTRK